MPGLLQQQQRALAPAQEDETVTPEEQEQYDLFVSNGMKLLYDQKVMPKLMESIRGGGNATEDGNPIEGLANALSMLVMRLEDSAAEKGQPISPDVMLHGGTELLEQMADLAEQAGVHTFDESEIETALYLALDTYRTTRQQQGKLPEDQLKADMQQLAQAEQDGSIDEIIPGITEYAKKAPKPDQAQRGA